MVPSELEAKVRLIVSGNPENVFTLSHHDILYVRLGSVRPIRPELGERWTQIHIDPPSSARDTQLLRRQPPVRQIRDIRAALPHFEIVGLTYLKSLFHRHQVPFPGRS